MSNFFIFHNELSAAGITEAVDSEIRDGFWNAVNDFNSDMTERVDDDKDKNVDIPIMINRIGITAVTGVLIEIEKEVEDGIDLRVINLAGHLLNQLADVYMNANPAYKKVKLTFRDYEPRYVSTTMFAHALKVAGNYMANMTIDEFGLILSDD